MEDAGGLSVVTRRRLASHPSPPVPVMWTLLMIAACAVAANGQEQPSEYQFNCPELYGAYVDPDYCDLYWSCTEGVPELKECQDGHAFDPRLRGNNYPCNYVFQVNCTGRELLQDPQPGVDPECERQHGIFLDPVLCSTFYTCKNGLATKGECASSLHVHQETRECVWPEVANRGSCDTRETLGQFSCPLEAVDALDFNGNPQNNPTYANEEDCRLFYICLNGIKPMPGGCPEGTVYSIDTEKCTDATLVPGCEAYYGDLEIPDNFENTA